MVCDTLPKIGPDLLTANNFGGTIHRALKVLAVACSFMICVAHSQKLSNHHGEHTTMHAVFGVRCSAISRGFAYIAQYRTTSHCDNVRYRANSREVKKTGSGIHTTSHDISVQKRHAYKERILQLAVAAGAQSKRGRSPHSLLMEWPWSPPLHTGGHRDRGLTGSQAAALGINARQVAQL